VRLATCVSQRFGSSGLSYLESRLVKGRAAMAGVDFVPSYWDLAEHIDVATKRLLLEFQSDRDRLFRF
jgi:hypothetical protein